MVTWHQQDITDRASFGSQVIFGYRCLGNIISPFLWPYLNFRVFLGKEESSRLSERFGYASILRPSGPLVWFHAASVGETIAIIELIREVCCRGICVLLTTGTMTSATLVKNRLGEEVIHQYAPLDVQSAISRFLDYWKPDSAIISESEIWPVTILGLSVRRIPQILVNARMSSRSFNKWHAYPSISKKIFNNLSLVVAQSEIDCTRYRELGAHQVLVSGNLKMDVSLPPYDEKVLSFYQQQIKDRYTWAAISTFEGEENVAGHVQHILKQKNNVLTILVPRHPERCDAIEKLLLSQGLKVARRTRGDILTSETDVFLGDTIGEMGLYLRLTEIAFVGRSLFGEGGQNPLEPAMLGCAILSGPKVHNFDEIYQNLISAEASCFVQDEEQLSKIIQYLLSNKDVRDKMIKAAMNKVYEMQGQGALKITLRALEPYINPLAFQASLLPKKIL
ncbi:3-deoxy-D-manno-octulosonic-acid transferase [Liberibacter crescens BT-1]|uniref:3-deoxy-D-manno-octulosonic acid transferase n=1 Tax=Liberibacter crescens (strain BT-1) TaxID=1215343 RepID=L0EV10_LIBCB|nr:lipid IV(A) 3-deoxy-D-manno-octulosonic acid transferase [Liberibacter crescens]AGA64226.1 3-deoxy-D-manno-octulosonic-acid transferase [Liberibacter crescens BT-1]